MIAATPPVLLWPARFLEAIRAERDAAANTLAAYQRDLDDYADFLTGRGLDYASAARAEIEDYMTDLSLRGMAEATRAPRRSSASLAPACPWRRPPRPCGPRPWTWPGRPSTAPTRRASS